MDSIEMEGKNIEDALEKAINVLKVDKDNIEYSILEEGSKGIFNIIGVKKAKVRVSIKYDYIKEAEKFLKNILKSMDMKADISITENDNVVNVNLSGSRMGLIIGHRGETLDAIQYLLSLIINKKTNIHHKKVILDTENYREKRKETLRNLAIKYSNKVKKSKKVFKFEPMNPYERRIIHSALQDDELISTYSEGEDPYRRVVIDLKK